MQFMVYNILEEKWQNLCIYLHCHVCVVLRREELRSPFDRFVTLA